MNTIEFTYTNFLKKKNYKERPVGRNEETSKNRNNNFSLTVNRKNKSELAEEKERLNEEKRKRKKKQSRVQLSRPGCERPPIHRCYPTTV